MLLAIVNRRLIALECGLVNPLQALALVLRNTCASHQESACSELCLSITTVGSQLIPESTFLQVLLNTVAIPKGCSYVLLTQHMTLEGYLAILEESLMVVTFYAIPKVIGVGHVHL